MHRRGGRLKQLVQRRGRTGRLGDALAGEKPGLAGEGAGSGVS